MVLDVYTKGLECANCSYIGSFKQIRLLLESASTVDLCVVVRHSQQPATEALPLSPPIYTFSISCDDISVAPHCRFRILRFDLWRFSLLGFNSTTTRHPQSQLILPITSTRATPLQPQQTETVEAEERAPWISLIQHANLVDDRNFRIQNGIETIRRAGKGRRYTLHVLAIFSSSNTLQT